MSDLTEKVKARARELGFDLVGVTGAEPSAFQEEYQDWVAQGYAGEMAYLTRNLNRRLDPRELLPGARTIIVVGMNYYTDAEEGPGLPKEGDPGLAIFARYARGDDYHEVGTDVGLPLGSEEAEAARIQHPWEHVREKEGDMTSRYVSFSEIVGGPKGGAGKFAKKDSIYKAAWDALKALEKEGQIRILSPADVEKMMLEQKPKIKKLAGEVRRLMEKHHEVLIEGRIPSTYILRAK